MNEHLQQRLSRLAECVSAQEDMLINGGSYTCFDYMHGMLNGMILAQSVVSNISPEYLTSAKKIKRTRVRHKSILIENRRRAR